MSEREKYRLLRLRKRIRLEQLAKVVGCHMSHLSNYENARTDMSEDKVEKYKSYIEMQPNHINIIKDEGTIWKH